MIVPMLLKIDPRALARGRSALARHRRHRRGQLAGQAVLHGAAGLAVHRPSVPPAAAGGPDRQLHRRTDPAGGRALHRHGVRLVEPGRRRAALHPEPGRAERHDHGGGIRADRRAAAWAVLDQRAVGHAAAVRRALHRGAGDRRAALAAGAACRTVARRRCDGRCGASVRCRWPRCC